MHDLLFRFNALPVTRTLILISGLAWAQLFQAVFSELVLNKNHGEWVDARRCMSAAVLAGVLSASLAYGYKSCMSRRLQALRLKDCMLVCTLRS